MTHVRNAVNEIARMKIDHAAILEPLRCVEELFGT
jgi:hypothetical protein